MLAYLFLCASWLIGVLAMPSFEGVTSWSSIGSLVPGMTALEALGPSASGHASDEPGQSPFYFSIDAPHGLTGNATVKKARVPPLFYIHGAQLFNYHNASTIYPVQVVNGTRAEGMPLQIVVGTPRGDVVRGGTWRWQGTQLFYELGTANNGGVYYGCQNADGLMGLFLFLRGSPTPPGCTLFTVHSFMRRG